MFKSIKNIITLLVIVVGILGIYLGVMLTAFENTSKIVQDTSIVINDAGKIKVQEEISFLANENDDEISLKRTLYVNEDGSEYWHKKPENVAVYLNNEPLKNIRNANWKQASYYLSNTGIVIENIDLIKDKEYLIKINYEYDTSDAVLEYSNLAILKIMTEEQISGSNIKIQLPQETQKFKLNSNAKVEYLGNNTYNINGKMREPYSELLIDKGIIKNAKLINEEYETSNIKRTLISEDAETISILVVMSTITVITLIITLIITIKPRMQKKYVRNPEEVIEPILAESIIDRKIGAKELIMSCIVELIYRGNLKNIGNEKIQLIHGDNMSKYELEIIGLLFKGRNQIKTFEEIKEIFINNNQKTKDFFDKFNNIKNKIEEKLFDYNIYSKTGEKLLKILRTISIVGMIDMVYMFLGIMGVIDEHEYIYEIIKCTIWATGFAIFKVWFSKIKIETINIRKTGRLGISLMSLLLVAILTLIFQGYKYIGTLVIIFIIFGINVLIYIKTNSHVLTKTGKHELSKAQGLKDYIVDYSLMKDRELESVIVWDEYLAYAVAFGIPNKIIAKFDENLMNANIIIQKIENILEL